MGSIIIAIDGFSSTGKSTIAKRVARELGYVYIDTGAMYRGVTLYALRKGWLGPGDRIDVHSIVEHLNEVELEFRNNDAEALPADRRLPSGWACDLILNGENVSREIRSMEVSDYVSQVAAIREVRKRLVALQKDMGSRKGIVMDGRDIGTVVFPDAELKVFLTATVEQRAMRRYEELLSRGEEVSLEEVTENLQRRDHIDSSRETDPLRAAEDAIVFDNSNWTVDQQFVRIYELARDRIATSV